MFVKLSRTETLWKTINRADAWYSLANVFESKATMIVKTGAGLREDEGKFSLT